MTAALAPAFQGFVFVQSYKAELMLVSGTDVAVKPTDPVLTHDDLRVVDAIRAIAADFTDDSTKPLVAFGYTASALPLAAFDLLNPMIQAAVRSRSTLFAVTNGL